ncbi:MAG: hypothetical protein K6F49_06920 [Saccharofermentans sp.]|nr:hypothetical protein [Saccharofermentans sp.]
MKIYQAKGRECFFYVVRKWPKIIIGALIVAVLFGVKTGYDTHKSWDQKQADVDTIMQQREALVEMYDQSLATIEADIESTEKETIEYKEFLDGAVILRADENATGIASVDLYFVSYNEDGTVKDLPDGSVELFASALTNSIDWERVATSVEIPSNFLDQFLIISIDETNNRMMTLKMFGLDAGQAEGMLNDILNQASVIKEGYISQIPGFDYTEMNKVSYNGRAPEYIETRSRIQNRYNELLVAARDLYASKDALEAPPEAVYMPTKAQVTKSIIKHTVFGGAIGVVVMVALFYVLFYLNGKLHSADELAYYTDSNAMAYLSPDKKRSILYRFFAKKENNGLLYSQKDAVLRTVSNIKAQYPEATKVMFTGINADSEAESLKKALAGAKGMGFMFGIEKNILTDKEAFDHVSYYDAVVLVEKADMTSIELINKEIEQINLAGKKIASSLLVR